MQEENQKGGGFIGGLKKVVNMYVQSQTSGATDGLTAREKQSPVKPIINKSLKDTRFLGMTPLTYITVSFSIVAICGVAILSIKNK
jgi:hypothetical protein